MEKKIKILAFHLPQYHEFEENNKWWGKGFTEWVNVKKAKPLFKDHYQPRVPLEKNYYNMLDYETRKKQSELAKEYCIDGFCFYHYWFNGKLLMEKPIEKFLNEKNNIEYCFCWANENWTRAWNGQDKEILIAQNYGDKNEWIDHINYLMAFFKDDRYIKIDNKPVIIIYRTKDIENINEIIEVWDEECKINGFDGIYLIEELNGFQNKSYVRKGSALMDFEPGYTQRYERSVIEKTRDRIMKIINISPRYRLFDYDRVWKKIIKRKYDKNKKVFLGAFVDWDNSPRRSKDAKIFINGSVEKFEFYFSKLYKKAIEEQSDFIFINAWNEWAEGTYLEPDEKNKYGYLESIRRIVKNEG